MPGGSSFRGRQEFLTLCPCDVFRALINFAFCSCSREGLLVFDVICETSPEIECTFEDELLVESMIASVYSYAR